MVTIKTTKKKKLTQDEVFFEITNKMIYEEIKNLSNSIANFSPTLKKKSTHGAL